MRSEDFILSFRETLTGEVSDAIIQENVTFYRQYIRKQMEQGRTEDEVLESLGNPRLLAKTIIEREKFKNAGKYEEADTDRGRKTATESKIKEHALQLPGWIAGILAVFVIALLIGLAFCVISYLAPLLVACAIGVCVYRLIKRYR